MVSPTTDHQQSQTAGLEEGSGSSSTSYVFSSKPQPVGVRRNKYRPHHSVPGSIEGDSTSLPPHEREPPINILHDPRVYHGSTYNLARTYLKNNSKTAAAGGETVPPLKPPKRRLHNIKPPSIFDFTVEDPLRQEIALEPFLIEQSKPVNHVTQDCQTDQFQPRPSTPTYVPAKTGVDTSTAVQEDLFDFDKEVEPLLSVLVQKTLDQALLEVVQEEELVAIQKALEECLARKAAEEAAVKQREALTNTEYNAKATCLDQERRRLKKEQRVQKKVMALQMFRALSHEMFYDTTFHELERVKRWRTPTEQSIRASFMPWLMGETMKGYKRQEVAHALLDDVLAAVYARQKDIMAKARQQNTTNATTT